MPTLSSHGLEAAQCSEGGTRQAPRVQDINDGDEPTLHCIHQPQPHVESQKNATCEGQGQTERRPIPLEVGNGDRERVARQESVVLLREPEVCDIMVRTRNKNHRKPQWHLHCVIRHVPVWSGLESEQRADKETHNSYDEQC